MIQHRIALTFLMWSHFFLSLSSQPERRTARKMVSATATIYMQHAMIITRYSNICERYIYINAYLCLTCWYICVKYASIIQSLHSDRIVLFRCFFCSSSSFEQVFGVADKTVVCGDTTASVARRSFTNLSRHWTKPPPNGVVYLFFVFTSLQSNEKKKKKKKSFYSHVATTRETTFHFHLLFVVVKRFQYVKKPHSFYVEIIYRLAERPSFPVISVYNVYLPVIISVKGNEERKKEK